MFRGVDFIEMAAQFLGVIWGLKHPTLLGKMACAFKRIKEASFDKFTFAEDVLFIKIEEKNIREKTLGGPEIESIMVPVIGEEFLIRGEKNKGKVAQVKSIRLIFGNPKLLGVSKLS